LELKILKFYLFKANLNQLSQLNSSNVSKLMNNKRLLTLAHPINLKDYAHFKIAFPLFFFACLIFILYKFLLFDLIHPYLSFSILF
jgi:hypothetical protein